MPTSTVIRLLFCMCTCMYVCTHSPIHCLTCLLTHSHICTCSDKPQTVRLKAGTRVTESNVLLSISSGGPCVLRKLWTKHVAGWWPVRRTLSYTDLPRITEPHGGRASLSVSPPWGPSLLLSAASFSPLQSKISSMKVWTQAWPKKATIRWPFVFVHHSFSFLGRKPMLKCMIWSLFNKIAAINSSKIA